jgi:hypothetical protein
MGSGSRISTGPNRVVRNALFCPGRLFDNRLEESGLLSRPTHRLMSDVSRTVIAARSEWPTMRLDVTLRHLPKMHRTGSAGE